MPCSRLMRAMARSSCLRFKGREGEILKCARVKRQDRRRPVQCSAKVAKLPTPELVELQPYPEECVGVRRPSSKSTASPRRQAQQPCLTRIRPGIAHRHRRGWVAVSRVTQRDTISVDPDFDLTTVWKPAMPISTRLSGFPIRAASGYRPALPSPSRARKRRCFVRKAKGRGILVWRNLAGQCLVTRIDLDLWPSYHGQRDSPNGMAAHAIRPPTSAESWPWKPCPLHLKLTSLVRESGLVTQSWMMTSAIRTSRSASRDFGLKK